MNNTAKRNFGIMCFIPFIAWSIWCAYIMILTRPLIVSQTFQDHEKIVTDIAAHYTPVLVLVGIAALITAIVLFVCVVHLAKIKTMNAGNKAAWVVFMIAFGAMAFPIFWYAYIRHEPKNVPMYADIS